MEIQSLAFKSDPLFANPGQGDYHLRSRRGRHWPEHDVWVLDEVTSPCIDGGDPDHDFSKEPSPNGGRVNMGVYGGTTFASLSPGHQPPVVYIAFQDYGVNQRFVEAFAWDVDGRVIQVEWFVDGASVGVDTDPSDGWKWELMLLSGEYSIMAVATDNDNRTGSVQTVISISRGGGGR